MQLHRAVQLVVADQRGYCGKPGMPALRAIKHVRNSYTHDTVNARWQEGSITHRPTAAAYGAVIDADGYELGMLFAAWEPAQSTRPGPSLWLALPVIVIAIVVLAAIIP
jgi:hypothetical protein